MSPSASSVLDLDGAVAAFSGWALIEITGRHRERFLASQVTSDVTGLAEGESQPSALLDRTGRLQAAFFLRKRAEAIELLVPEGAVETCVEKLEAHLIADDVQIRRRNVDSMRLALGPAAVAMTSEMDEDRRFPVSGWGQRGFVTWGDGGIDLPELSTEELETLRVLGGPPLWGREVRSGQLINETALLDTAVSFSKGCYLGQETVAKVASHRGAVRAPVLLELNVPDISLESLVGRWFAVGERAKAGEVLSASRRDGVGWLQVSLHRELRVVGRELRCSFDQDTTVTTTVHEMPLLPVPSREEMADRLTVAASAAFAAEQVDRALELLGRAVVVCPAWADAYESLGVILGRLGRYEEAVSQMNRLLEIEPSSVMAHSNLSLFFNQLGDIEAAENHLALATRASFEGGSAGDRAAQNKRDAEAAEADRLRRAEMFREVLEIDPDDPLAHLGMGELALEAERFDDAVDHLERTIQSDPNHSAAILALGSALEGLSETGRAHEVFERGVETAAKNGDLATAKKMQERITALAGQAP